MTGYSQSIWQKIRNLFTVGYNKVATQEMQLANAFQGKLAGIGYIVTRLFFFVLKVAVFVVLAWLALWLAIFLFIGLLAGFVIFRKKIKEFQKNPEQFKEAVFNANKSQPKGRTFDSNGNIID